jgi:pyruvate,orthophosphate dikinase
MEKYVYSFGGGSAEGRGDQKLLLGGKGSGLAEMAGLGLPVPPGFTVTTTVCHYYHAHQETYPDGLAAQFDEKLAWLETALGRKFGDPHNPLLVSVRSGAPASMPGMMDTILNLGLNRATVDAQIAAGGSAHFWFDCYRRLIGMYGDVVLGVDDEPFELLLKEARGKHGVRSDAELPAAAMEGVARQYLEHLRQSGKPFPESAKEQLWGALGAVFQSWNNQRAVDYRRLYRVPESYGTAVNVQAMVFGNRGPQCATGVAFTRDPGSGEKRLYGEYLINAQGEDVVAGIRTPHQIRPRDGKPGLGEEFPQALADLAGVCQTLEAHRRDMQDVEFTIEDGRLFMLQTRNGKRTGVAAIRIAVDMVEEGLIQPQEALNRVEPDHLVQLLAPVFALAEKTAAVKAGRLLGRGLGAGPGAAAGRVALSAERAAEMAKKGPVILVRDETSPEDIVGMHAAAGILTSRGGMTSHAAVVARGMGKPCIVGAGELHVDEKAGTLRAGERTLREGDELSIDGTTGEVLAGALAPRPSEVVQVYVEGKQLESRDVDCFTKLLSWADAERRLEVWANGDTPHDAKVARAFGAQGIGLCRTEHMFFDEERISWVRQMILGDDQESRRVALGKLLPMQQGDFEGILEAMVGLPVTIRLLDPPLHEFLPHEAKAQEQVAAQMGISQERVREKTEALAESNPMLGHRGCRLGLTAPDIYAMQVEAIARAACVLVERGLDVQPEIMMPLVGTEEEMKRLRAAAEAVLERVFAEQGRRLRIPIGTMIEVPRAALAAGEIARHAEFFSFGTNDLTQMTFGYSRDDVAKFLPDYLEAKILPVDPFASLDAGGVGQLVQMACARGRATRPDLTLGVCGEHGGDPASVEHFHRYGLDYVSCSPYRVPVARLAAARANLGHGAGGGDA